MPNDIRSTSEYREGQRAYDNRKGYSGQRVDSLCPYPCGNFNASRTAWFTGWYDARTEERLGYILRKYGETWP